LMMFLSLYVCFIYIQWSAKIVAAAVRHFLEPYL
jgi:hypothetical protein